MATIYRFGPFELRLAERALLCDGQIIKVGARAFDVLVALIERRDRLVDLDELFNLVWPGLVVEENNLAVQISALRRALGSDAIATVRGRGYRFTAQLQPTTDPDARQPPLGPAFAHDHAAIALLQFEPGRWHVAGLLVAQHGGTVQPGNSPERAVARFPSCHAAAACALRFDSDSGICVAILSPTDLPAPDGASGAEQALLAAVRRASPGLPVVSAGVADRLTAGLDGDLEDIGTDPDGDSAPPLRLFRLQRVQAAPSAPRVASAALELRPTVAIIPFATSDSSDQGFGIGDVLADQLTSLLSASALLNVTSRLSTSNFRNRRTPLARIAELLSAHFVVSGSCWRSGDRVTASVELADARSQSVLWARTVSDSHAAVLQHDSTLVLELANGLARAVVAAEIHGTRVQAFPDIESHTLLLGAIGLLYRLSHGDFTQAHAALQALHARVPRHALPSAWLARWHLFRVVQGWSDDRDADGRQALAFAQRALDIDPDSSLALTMMGNVHTSYLKDPDAAERFYEKATQLNPSESLAWLQWGNARSFQGDGATALAHAERAVGLSPLDPARHFYQSILASAALAAGQFERAIDAAHASVRLNNDHVSTHRVLAIALSLSDRLDEARVEVRRVLELEPSLTVETFIARSPGARSGLAQKFGTALHAAGLPLSRSSIQSTEVEKQ